MLAELWLPILISTVAVFFTSFVSWMILKFHKQDWSGLAQEETVMAAVRDANVTPGNYMFPYCSSAEEMKSEAHQQKIKAGPNGVLSVFPPGEGMGAKLGQTFGFFLAANFCIAYLATLALPSGAEFMAVFRFVSTASFLTYFAGAVPGCIWYRHRITGHLIDAVMFAVIVGAIFGGFWPDA